MKTFSLLKAALSQDMNLFKYSAKRNSSKLTKILFPIMIFILVCFSIGTYAYMIAEKLAPFNLTYIMVSMFIMIVTLMTFIEGIYKSQGILFESKDNDLLFSLPIKKYQILFIRIFKLLLFQYIYNLMFLLPAFAIFIYFEKPGINFYLISLLMTLLIPIIPTVISSFIGYIIKLLSSKFKSKKIVQTLLSSIIFLGIFYFSMNLENFIQDIASKATGINNMLTSIYYPLGLYINLINGFNLLDLLKLLLVNIIPFILFIVIGSKVYFKIIFNSKENNCKKNNKKSLVLKRKPIISLVRKELKKYYSSPVYMFNTSFGLLLSVILSIYLCFKGSIVFDEILVQYGIQNSISFPVLFYFFILFVTSMTSITSSSISLEGKTINITKSLPINEELILKSKILTCYIIELPFIVFSDIIFFIKFKPNLFYLILIILIGLISILLIACIGLIINLKYPKMNATNDTEVVKQSMSSMISVFIGIGIFVGSILFIVFLGDYINIDILLILHISLITIISIILYYFLMKNGTKEYKKINV
ncbi:MAG: hypothetical protein PUD59_02710 [bacterium]|nr:hypothetical protein [bacterium]